MIVVGAGHAGTEAAVAAARLGRSVGDRHERARDHRPDVVQSRHRRRGQGHGRPRGRRARRHHGSRDGSRRACSSGCSTGARDPRCGRRARSAIAGCIAAPCDRYSRSNAATSHGPGNRRAGSSFDGAERASAGIETLEGRRFGARAVVVTTGHVPARPHSHRNRRPGSAAGARARRRRRTSPSSSRRLGLTVARFKTGTPPRIDGRSVDFDAARAPGERDRAVRLFLVALLADAAPAWVRRRDTRSQMPCWITFLGRGGQADHPGAHRRVGDVRRCDRVARPALLPVGRGQDREVSGGGAASALPRAGGTRHGGAVRQRAVDVAAGAGAGGDTAHGARPRAGAHDAGRIRDRVRLLSADAARRDAPGERGGGTVLRRTDQRHDRLRGGGRPGDGRGAQRRAVPRRLPASCSVARLRISAC